MIYIGKSTHLSPEPYEVLLGISFWSVINIIHWWTACNLRQDFLKGTVKYILKRGNFLCTSIKVGKHFRNYNLRLENKYKYKNGNLPSCFNFWQSGMGSISWHYFSLKQPYHNVTTWNLPQFHILTCFSYNFRLNSLRNMTQSAQT